MRSHETPTSDTPNRRQGQPRGAMPDLQGTAGNRAVAGLVQPRSVQRFGVMDVLLGPLGGAAAEPVLSGVEGLVGQAVGGVAGRAAGGGAAGGYQGGGGPGTDVGFNPWGRGGGGG